MTREQKNWGRGHHIVVEHLVPPAVPPAAWDHRLGEVRVVLGGALAARQDRDELSRSIARLVAEERTAREHPAEAELPAIALTGLGLDPSQERAVSDRIAAFLRERLS